MKKYKPIIVVAGEPNSIFLELFFKVLKKNKIKSPIILIASKKLLLLQMKYLKFKMKIKDLDFNKIPKYNTLLNNYTMQKIKDNYKDDFI